ncbi:bifunctional D-glycero-beta-D-manno-heptose-7-phosphate kinase/D-glycero-beta-D-manno-heptose 1-phosphate adenylyltransferase HldE [Sansalvadorimonas verongulae]|uniref:bifunctional D-glycero-beta-D-manno-heptose-7-phosphate kinase/D-glycero-beta-D-manno-heptose 1-phosphate adenylyltransferase HldE n=1 Tax=Sansalvadorimonas verongulae TaxID=2172824 RepID=UPI0012BB995C|nr:bifunctional D-glycero-beta-D-manno-heptose-7-phosphate kinase/D-glycero-beta-D-manno-heptose 1-phosphate adenylyltransferase HldE [Sansalvadorimonas verongulae]MTI15598.1 bifunctional D-glycero-beta-D-manno-heptose-7-phosphate kinase/D-glycero-beta-D-manno-heptose 1-phosphate adenylyltransferase HldE [Sansalvadorimonas verongulae]
MKLTLPRFDKARVVVAGDVMLDRYWHGPTRRISPEAPVPVVRVTSSEDRPGGAGNVALNITSLGAPVWLLGATGNDEAADSLTSSLEAAGVSCDFIRHEEAPTITKLRIISQHQQLMRLDFEEPFAPCFQEKVPEHLARSLDNADALVLSDYGKGTLTDLQSMVKLARAKNIPVLADPKGSDFEKYRGATVITPNLSEFEAIVGPCPDETTLVEKGQKLRQELELEALLITRSEHGMTLLRAGKELHFPAQAREVFDVTGAGDTVIGTLAAGLASGLSLPEATGLANIAAGIVVGKLGTATVSMPELRRAVSLVHGIDRGVMTREQLANVVEDARAQGERIVFTNGCFDILHAGHVGYLEEARKQGDRLILAINDDASVHRLKGEGRPINPVERRMAVLAGLEAVDWVLPFHEDTPEELLKLLKPDVLVKGGDYSVEQVVGAPIVHEYGGEVAVLEFLDNCSTTAIVRKIRREEDKVVG